MIISSIKRKVEDVKGPTENDPGDEGIADDGHEEHQSEDGDPSHLLQPGHVVRR